MKITLPNCWLSSIILLAHFSRALLLTSGTIWQYLGVWCTHPTPSLLVPLFFLMQWGQEIFQVAFLWALVLLAHRFYQYSCQWQWNGLAPTALVFHTFLCLLTAHHTLYARLQLASSVAVAPVVCFSISVFVLQQLRSYIITHAEEFEVHCLCMRCVQCRMLPTAVQYHCMCSTQRVHAQCTQGMSSLKL